MILGVANVIPGVSGGTMAVVFNIYDRLISVITLNVKKIVSEWKFILPLVAGIVLGVILFSKVITFLFQNYPVQTNWFFIGIILGSIPMILKRMLVAGKNGFQGAEKKAVPVSAIVCGVVALGIMAIMTYANVAEFREAIDNGEL